MASKGGVRLAAKAFQHVALYDTLVSRYLRGDTDPFPAELTLALRQALGAALRREPAPEAPPCTRNQGWRAASSTPSSSTARSISFNNVLDADAAWRSVSDFAEPTIAIIKHTNPCGLASHEHLPTAYERALSGDPISAFGGIVACNRTDRW